MVQFASCFYVVTNFSMSKGNNDRGVGGVDQVEGYPFCIDEISQEVLDKSSGTESDVDVILDPQKEIEKALNELDRSKQLIAVLGFTGDEKVEFKRMPQGYKAMRVHVPENEAGKVVDLLNEVAYSCNNGGFVAKSAVFVGTGLDRGGVSFDYVIPSDKITKLKSGLDDDFIYFKLDVDTSDSSQVLYSKGNGVSVVGAKFEEFADGPKIYSLGTICYPTDKSKSAPSSFDKVPVVGGSNVLCSLGSLDAADIECVKVPRQGVCAYLWIDGKFAEKWGTDEENKEEMRALLSQLRVLTSSKNYSIYNYGGGFLIIDTAERGGAELVEIASGLNKIFDEKVNMFVNAGNVEHHDFDENGVKVSIDNLLSIGGKEKTIFNKFNGGVFLAGEIYDSDKGELKGRDGTRFRTDANDVSEEAYGYPLYKLISHTPNVKLKRGGPDRPIGIDDKISTVGGWIKDPKVKVVEIYGGAGMGKSCLMYELAKMCPGASILSMSASGKGTPMHGLATIMMQEISHLNGMYVDYNKSFEEEDLLKFDGFLAMMKSSVEMRRFIQADPFMAAGLFKKMLKVATQEKGELVVFLDDIHDADKDTIGKVVDILRDISFSSSPQDITFVIGRRDDEGEEPLAYKELKKLLKEKGMLKEQEVDGLNFSDREITHDYALSSLPSKVRESFSTGRLSGNWYMVLGEMAVRSPFKMTDAMDLLLMKVQDYEKENEKSPWMVEDGGITLYPRFFDKVEGVVRKAGRDMGGFLQERINKLSTMESWVVECVAMLGGAVNKEQFNVLCDMFKGIDEVDVKALVDGRYLVSSENGGYAISHPIMTEVILKSTKNEEKVKLSKMIYERFQKDEGASVDSGLLLSVLHNIAGEVSFDDEGFWEEYAASVSVKFEECKIESAPKEAFSTAMNVVNRPGTSIKKFLADFVEDPTIEIPENILKLITDSLVELAKNAIIIGKYSEGKEAIKLLEVFLKRGFISDEKRQEIYGIMFELEYVGTMSRRGGGGELKKIYEEKFESGKELASMRKVLFELKIAYRGMDMEKIGELESQYASEIKENSNESSKFFKEYMEVFNLVNCRIPIEKLIIEVSEAGWDEDVSFQPGVLSSEQKVMLGIIKDDLEKLKGMKGKNPGKVSHYVEVSMLHQEQEIAAFLGDFDRAVVLAKEYGRQSLQMDAVKDFVSGYKMGGDFAIEKELTEALVSERGLDIEKIKRAIEIYSEGANCLNEIDKDDFYQLSIRIQRIRAIGLLVDAYIQQVKMSDNILEKAKIKADTEKYLKIALADFKYINEDPKWKECAGKWEGGYVQYYLSGCMWPLIDAVEKSRLVKKDAVKEDIDSIYDWPYMLKENVEWGKEYSVRVKVPSGDFSDLGERDRKFKNIDKLLAYISLKGTNKSSK